MKILTVCQYYYPEPFRITDICEELVKRGHEVTVITGLPNYPMGQIYDGYRHGEKRDETINGVRIHRCFTIGRRKGIFFRFLNYYTYAFSSSLYVNKLSPEYDVVFINQLSPIMMANAGIHYKKKHQKKLVLYCLDLWPESLVSGGIKPNSLLYRLFRRVSERIYSQADRILVTSKSFAKYFREMFGFDDTEYLPQYAEALFLPDECHKKPNGTTDLLFAGNIGAAQSVDTIIRAAALTSHVESLRWHIVGDGSELVRIKALASELGLHTITFYGRRPLEEMPKYYAMADAMLVSLTDDTVLSLTLPGKVQTYMAAGKPIIGSADGETKEQIQNANCGYCAKACDPVGLARLAERFAAEKDVANMGNSARSYYDMHFSREGFFAHLLSALEHNDNSNCAAMVTE